MEGVEERKRGAVGMSGVRGELVERDADREGEEERDTNI